MQSARTGEMVMPGYLISDAEEMAKQNKKVVLGNGLKSENDSVKSTKRYKIEKV